MSLAPSWEVHELSALRMLQVISTGLVCPARALVEELSCSVETGGASVAVAYFTFGITSRPISSI